MSPPGPVSFPRDKRSHPCYHQRPLPVAVAPRGWGARRRRSTAGDCGCSKGAAVAQAEGGQYVICQLAEVTVPRRLFAAILERIARLRLAWCLGVRPGGLSTFD